MLSVDMGPQYAEVGQHLADDVRGDPEGAFLYAEIAPGMIACSIFKDLGDRVIYRECSDQLTDKLMSIWNALDKRDQWFSISYSINNGRFDASFDFPDHLNPKEGFSDRRPRIIKARFGDKPVDYSDP